MMNNYYSGTGTERGKQNNEIEGGTQKQIRTYIHTYTQGHDSLPRGHCRLAGKGNPIQ